MNILDALAFAPILRGFIVLVVAGAVFPLTGVFILRLNLITLRFMLMHGTLLGGAVALGMGLDPLTIGILINILLILGISGLSRSTGLNTGHVTTFFMVFTIGLAFTIMYVTGVPAKDTMAILWGNIYALTNVDAVLTGAFALLVLVFVTVFSRQIRGVLFDREVAFTSGLADGVYYNTILLITGLTIAFCMKLIGALLLDALILLPAIVAGLFAKSAKAIFLISAIVGFAASIGGFFVSLAADLPASSSITLLAALVLGVSIVYRKVNNRNIKNRKIKTT